jgi:hypothetical protein
VICDGDGCGEGGPHELSAPGHVALALAQGWRPRTTAAVDEGPVPADHPGAALLEQLRNGDPLPPPDLTRERERSRLAALWREENYASGRWDRERP